MSTSIHPTVDAGVKKGKEGFEGGALRCLCAVDPVEVKIGAQVAFNHACAPSAGNHPARCSRSLALFRATR